MNSWKRRWCVLKDETFLWFRSKQEALKQGWLHKKGGGSSTLSRRNWKRRWFVLRQARLMYFENDSEEKLKGTVEVRTAKYVADPGLGLGLSVLFPPTSCWGQVLLSSRCSEVSIGPSLFPSVDGIMRKPGR